MVKVELNEKLIYKNCINEYGSNYEIKRKVVIDKKLRYDLLNCDDGYGVYELVNLIDEDCYNKIISGNSDNKFDDYNNWYRVEDLEKYYVKNEEEYKEYYKGEIERIINNNLKKIEELNKNKENLNNILNN